MIKVNFKFSNDKSGHLDILTVNLFDTPLAKSWAYAVALNNKERNFYIKFYDRNKKYYKNLQGKRGISNK